MAVQGPTFRPKLGSFYLYQDHEACSVSPEKAKDQIDPVLGRHAGVESVERGLTQTDCLDWPWKYGDGASRGTLSSMQNISQARRTCE